MVRAAKRMFERVGYDPQTGLHLEAPPTPKKETLVLEDGKLSIITAIFSLFCDIQDAILQCWRHAF